MELRRSFGLKIKEEVVVKEEEDSDCLIHQDVHRVIVGEEEQQERSCSLDQDQEEPEPPHIKEEQEELWSSQEGEQQLQGLEEADITKFTFTPVPVKSEDDGEKPQSSQLHQTHTEHMETEAAGEDCGGPGPHRDPGPHLQPETDIKASDSSETEVSDDDWMETREKPQAGSTSLTYNDNPVGGSRRSERDKPISCSVCGKRFIYRTHLNTHMRTHTGEKPFRCPFCMKSFAQSGNLQIHMRIHTGEKPFSCSECGKTFGRRAHLKTHMISHSGENPFSCSECGKTFSESSNLKRHIKTHTGRKRFSSCLSERRLTAGKRLTNNQCESSDDEDCGGPESDTCVKFNSNIKTEVSPEPEDSADIEFWKKIRKHQSGFTYQRNQKVSVKDGCSDDKLKSEPSVDVNISRQLQSGPNHLNTEDVSVSETGSNTVKKPLSSSECHQRPEDSHPNHNSPPTGEKPFSCSVCEKGFTLEPQLISHKCAGESLNKLSSSSKRQQARLKPFSCSVCGKEFLKRESLRSHMTSHNKEKPFHCSVCNAGFSDTEALIQHMRIHTIQTQFSCQICGEEFAWRRYLTKHMEVHSKETIYSCSAGDKTFRQPSELNHHQFVGELQLHESQTEENREAEPAEAAGEDCGGPEPDRYSDPDPDTEDQTRNCSEPEADDSGDSDFWTDNSRHLSVLNSLKHEEISQNDQTFNNIQINGIKQEEPEPPHIKEEQEELWSSQEGEQQLQGLEEADITKFTFTPVPVKSEDDGEKPQSSQLHQTHTEHMETEAAGEDCGSSSEPETDDSADWKETRKPQSSLNSVKKVPVSDMRLSVGEKSFSCSECGRRYSHRIDLKTHMRTHTGENLFNCSECGKTFVRKPDLKQHMRCHTGEKPFSCSFCQKAFSQRGTLHIHMKIHTGEKPFSCSVCDKRFLRRAHLRVHFRTHTGEKPFSCSVCEERFTHKVQLTQHMTHHTGEKPVGCPVCKKSFAQSGYLHLHMRIHSGEKPFSCSVCEKRFSRKPDLKKHMRTHTGEKPFSCSYCKKTFAQSGNLQKHVKIHTGEKPFGCSVCGKRFIQRCFLRLHMRTHTGEKSYSCSVCSQRFSWQQTLARHLKTHKDKKPPEDQNQAAPRDLKQA